MSILNSISESQNSNINFVYIQSVDEITYDNDKGYIEGRLIHGITFPTRTWTKTDRKFTEEILNLWWCNNIILPENPVSITMGDKRVLSQLWQEKNNVGYSEGELEAIEKFVPASYLLMSCDITIQEIIKKKDSFVMKPGIGLQGEQVLVGKYVSHSHWKDMISSEYDKPDFLLQQYESSISLAADSAGKINYYKGVWGAFSFGLEYSGVWIRMSMENLEFKGVINSALGATESIVFEIENNDKS
jgi:glutathionylspermidine synthase